MGKATILLVTLLAGCAVPTTPEELDYERYWPEAQYRLDYWLSWHRSCAPDYVRPTLSYFAPDPSLETCIYLPGDRGVRYNPRVLDGCAAHELGHAALHQAANPCWRAYEHDLEHAP